MVVKRKAVLAVVGALLAWGPRLASAEQTLDPNAVELPEVKAQLEQIRAESQALQAQLNQQRALTERLLGKIEALEHKDELLSQQVKSLSDIPAEAGVEQPAAPKGFIEIPRVNIRGFGDIGFSAKFSDTENSNTFTLGPGAGALGGINLYMTSELTDQVSALVEANFVTTSENAVSFGFQRGLLKYSLSDLVNITLAGRMHTPLGYWNQAYHHGPWLQTTIFRPEIYLFEADDGGFLPIHSVGIELSGVKEFHGVDVEYAFDVLNGRGRTVTEVQHAKDKNDSKALNLLVSLKPHAIEGLKLGASIYHDEIPSNPPTASRRESIDELILGQYVTYVHGRVELLAELFNIFHDDGTSGDEFDTVGLYLQGGYKMLDKVTPYYRFDFLDVANGDPFFTAPRNIDRTKHTWGLRWDPVSWNAIKFEYSFTGVKQRDDEHALTVNSSFAF